MSMIRLAIRNLIQNKTRLLISVAGVGLALTLVLAFGAIFTGGQGRLTVYIDNAGADVWVSQEGVRTLHMSPPPPPRDPTPWWWTRSRRCLASKRLCPFSMPRR